VKCGGGWERGAHLWIPSWSIPVATPRAFVVMRIFTGSQARRDHNHHLSLSSSAIPHRGWLGKADPGWETFEPTDVGSPDGVDRPSSARAGGEPNTPMVEVPVYSLRTRRDGSTAVDGHPVTDEFGAAVPSYSVMRQSQSGALTGGQDAQPLPLPLVRRQG